MIAREVYAEGRVFSIQQSDQAAGEAEQNPLRLRRNRSPQARQLLVVVNVVPQPAAD